MESIWKRMESMWKKYGIHVEKPWNPSGKPMESIHHSMESIHQKYGIHPPFHGIHLEFLQSIPPSMDSTWNNPGRVKYCLITITRSKGKFFVNILLQGVLVNIYQVSFNFELKRVSPALGLKQLASKNLRESRTF